MSDTRGKPPLFALALVSAAAIASQILWLRVMSVIQWHHFAFMVISLALLGYGASGTALTLVGGRLRRQARAAFAVCALLFAISIVPALLVGQALAFNPEELLWRPALLWNLAGLYLILGMPFFFAGGAVGIVLVGWGRMAGRVYAADLAGASVGALLAVASLWWLPAGSALAVAASAGALAAAMAASRMTTMRAPLAGGCLTVAMLLLLAPVPRPQLSEYKDLAQASAVDGAYVEAAGSSPHGELAVLASPRAPFRHAPGLGLRAGTEPPEQRMVFIDGNAVSAITRDEGDPDALGFLAALPSAAPYVLTSPERTLVLGAGAGLPALQARHMGARTVLAVEANPDVIGLVRGRYAEFSGGLYDGSPVSALAMHPRAFLAGHREAWDLIQLPPAGGSGNGLDSLAEDYLYTVEAISALLERLADDGLLALHSRVSLPPRDMLRLAATTVAALRRAGVGEPGRSILALRSWQWATILVRLEGFDGEDFRAMRSFADRYGYDLAWHDGLDRSAANRVNRMSRPWLYEAFSTLVAGEGGRLLNAYKFDLSPPTDDRPYFNNFLRWRTVPEILPLLGSGGMPLLEAGYLMLIAVFLQAIFFGVLLIVLPLAIGRARQALVLRPAQSWRVVGYFTAIGLAFMFMELSAIHRFILYLGQPVYASAVVIAAFLVFAGAGSLSSRRAALRRGQRKTALAGASGVAFFGSCWWLFLDPLLQGTGGWPLGIRVILALSCIGPLAFSMGHLFPVALAALSDERPDLVPWAWAVNGCASVIGAVGAVMVSVALGFDACLQLATVLYVATIAVFPVRASRARSPA